MTPIHIKAFCFNPFNENTYLIYNDSGNCWIVDPGCYEEGEQDLLSGYISEMNLKPERLFLTHAHIDHILGCAFIYRKYSLTPELHRNELAIYHSGANVGGFYGIAFEMGPDPLCSLEDGLSFNLGNSSWRCILCPGHSPGSICFYNQEQDILIGGDVLFEGSIGRTDLPGGNHDELIKNIKSRLFTLKRDVVVYPGHGGTTTIGQEILTNPFF